MKIVRAISIIITSQKIVLMVIKIPSPDLTNKAGIIEIIKSVTIIITTLIEKFFITLSFKLLILMDYILFCLRQSIIFKRKTPEFYF
jgi:hypothetical protein